MSRPTPLELVFGPMAAERFPAIREALVAAGYQLADRHGFVLVREAVELLRELRPDEGVGEGIDQLVAFVHASFLSWADDKPVVRLDRKAVERLLRAPGPPVPLAAGSGPTYYVQLPGRRIWGEPLAGAPPEPLDGWFARASGEVIDVVAIFGLHPTRPGLTAVEVLGPRPTDLRRPDGTPPFAPRLEGGEAAGLASIASAAELLELAYRVHGSLPGQPATGRSRLPSA